MATATTTTATQRKDRSSTVKEHTYVWEGLDRNNRQVRGEIKAASGPDSIGVLTSARITNEENYIAQKFTRAVLRTNSIDHCARL